MKERNRLFAILLSVVMAISYMPALAFAEAERDVPVDTATVEESLDVQPEAEAVEEQPAEEPEAVAPETAEPEAAEAEEVEEELVSTPEDPAAALEPAPEETLETPAKDFGKTDAEIVSIRFESHDGNPVKLTEGINGYYSSVGEEQVFHYRLDSNSPFDMDDSIIVEYNDGSSATYKSSYGSVYFVNTDNVQDGFHLPIEFRIAESESSSTAWGPDESHVFTLIYRNNEAISFTVPVRTVTNPIASIQFLTSKGQGTEDNPIELAEGVDGYIDAEGDGLYHYTYWYKNGDVLIISYSDGSTESYFYDNNKFVSKSGIKLDISREFPSLYTGHAYNEEWKIGEKSQGYARESAAAL